MKKVNFFIVFGSLLLLLLVFSCQQPIVDDGTSIVKSDEANALSERDSFAPVPEYVYDNGVVRYITLEGGFWGIIGKNGKYLPVNLPKQFCVNGLRVAFAAELLKDQASIYMWGKMIKIIRIEKAEKPVEFIHSKGVVSRIYIQGAPWIIKCGNAVYQPINLPREYQKIGLEVEFVAVIRKDIVIIPPIYPLIDIYAIRLACCY
jgi:hypothetical protein